MAHLRIVAPLYSCRKENLETKLDELSFYFPSSLWPWRGFSLGENNGSKRINLHNVINNLVFRTFRAKVGGFMPFPLGGDKSLSDDDREFGRGESCERTFAIGISRLGETSRHVRAILHAYFPWKYRNLGLRDSLNFLTAFHLVSRFLLGRDWKYSVFLLKTDSFSPPFERSRRFSLVRY